MVFALLSALLLILSFPKFSLWPLAWFSFVPIFYAVRRRNSFGGTFFRFYLFGFLFFLISVEWLRHVSYFGWIFVAAAYALYFGLFGLAVRWFWRRDRFLLSLFILPSFWCVLEWIRAEIPVWGFGWNLLAYSQAFNLTIASISSLIGAYGLSWLILFANLAIFFILDFELDHKKSQGLNALIGILSLAFIFGVYFSYVLNQSAGHSIVGAGLKPAPTIKVAVIQGNIAQSRKWDPNYKQQIIETYEKLSSLIVGKQNPVDLLIWPEAAYPGFFNIDPDRKRISNLARELKTPILLGGLHYERTEFGFDRYFNSAYLMVPKDGLEENRYDKVRLVSFGEYVPWRPFFNFFGLERLAYSLGVGDFEPGDGIKIFEIASTSPGMPFRNDEAANQKKFSVLICFEDTFPNLAREAVRKGANFLVVITNDAWFSRSAAPDQHLQASILRAIENGVPVIRAANTGISAVITDQGAVLERVKDQAGNDSFIAGGISASISLTEETTFYQKKGYLIPYLCLIFMVVGSILGLRVKK